MTGVSSLPSHPTSAIPQGEGFHVKTKEIRSFSTWLHSLEKIVTSKKMGDYWVSNTSPWRLAQVSKIGQPKMPPVLNHFSPLTLEKIWFVSKMMVDGSPKEEAALGWLIGRVGFQEQLKQESFLNCISAIFDRISNFCHYRRFQTGGEMIQEFARKAMRLDKISPSNRAILQMQMGYYPEANVTIKWKGNYPWKTLCNADQAMVRELGHLRDNRYHDTTNRKLDRLTAIWLVTGESASYSAELASRIS